MNAEKKAQEYADKWYLLKDKYTYQTVSTKDLHDLASEHFGNGYNADRWIPVSEGLPEYGAMVLVFNPSAVIKQYTMFYMPSHMDDCVGVFGTNAFNPEYNITHWQPLQSPISEKA